MIAHVTHSINYNDRQQKQMRERELYELGRIQDIQLHTLASTVEHSE
jgi:hypothetical protein